MYTHTTTSNTTTIIITTNTTTIIITTNTTATIIITINTNTLLLYRGIMERIPSVVLNGDPDKRYIGNLNFSFAYVEGESLLMVSGQLNPYIVAVYMY